MSNFTVSRNVNEYIFTRNDGKKCSIDIASKEAKGFSGKVIQSKPKCDHPLFEALWDIYRTRGYWWNIDKSTSIEVINRMISLGYLDKYRGANHQRAYNPSAVDDFFLRSDHSNATYLEKANWKIITRYYKDHDKVEKSFGDIITEEKMKSLSYSEDELALLSDIYHHTGDFSHSGYSHYFRYRDVATEPKDRLNYVLKVFSPKPYPDRILETFGISAVYEQIDTLFKTMTDEDLTIKMPSGSDWFGILYEVKSRLDSEIKLRRAEKMREENEAFAKFQTSINLKYENDKYDIIVPTNYEELVEWGDKLHNCFAHWEWDNQLKNHNRRLVVIVSKTDKNDVVGCDIFVNNNEIGQYYTFGNQTPSVSARDFQSVYQTYLSTLPILKWADLS